MKPAPLILAVAVVIALAGCGAAEKTKTVTVTTEAKPAAPPPTEESSKSTESETTEAESGSKPTATTIPDGTWQLGRDYKPGLYRAPGGANCFWEKNKVAGGSAEGLGNGSGETNPEIQIDSPFFKTEECGTWHKVG